MISPTKASIFITKETRTNLRFPNFFSTLALNDKKIRVKIEAMVKSKPTMFSEKKAVRKVEFTKADRAICRLNKKDRIYIVLIFDK